MSYRAKYPLTMCENQMRENEIQNGAQRERIGCVRDNKFVKSTDEFFIADESFGHE